MLLTADHGEQFRERGNWGQSLNLNAEEIRVPFILKHNGINGRETAVVSHVDIMPTLAEIGGVVVENKINGFSLLSQFELRQKIPVLDELKGGISQKAFMTNDKALITQNGNKLLIGYYIE